jgi:hypothetical protein
MKKSVLFGLLVVASATAGARDIYVSPTGNDKATGATSAVPLKTIAAAASLANAGDTVQLLPGRYKEAIVPVRSGTPERPITFRSAGPQPAVLTHDSKRGLPDAISISGVNDILIDGINVDGVASGSGARVDRFARIVKATRITIRNGVFKYAYGWQGIAVSGGASYVTIENNTIDWVGLYDSGATENSDTGDAIEVRAYNGEAKPHHVLIQGNTLRHAGHDLLRVSGRYCVIQDNFFNNSYRDVLGGNSGGRIGSVLGEDNVVQRNYIAESGKSSDSDTQVLLKIEGQRNIARHNIFAHGLQQGLLSGAGEWSPDVYQFRIYNNTFYKLGAGAWLFESYGGTKLLGKGVFANNAIVDSRLVPLKSANDADVEIRLRVNSTQKPTADSIIRGNYFSPKAGKAPRVAIQGFGEMIDLPKVEATYPALFSGNRQERVQFTKSDPASPQEFDLRAGSPGIDGGVFLTRAVGSGKSNKLKVADSLYFTDGFGLVPGDMVQLQGSTERARVVRADHATGTLELDSTLEVKDGQGVALQYVGAAPDVGAREFGERPPSPPKKFRAGGT